MREICFENCLSLSRFDQRWCVDILHLKWKSNISLRVFSNFQDNSFDAYTFIKCVKKVVSICITRSSTVLKTFTHPNDSFFVFSVLVHLKSESCQAIAVFLFKLWNKGNAFVRSRCAGALARWCPAVKRLFRCAKSWHVFTSEGGAQSLWVVPPQKWN